MADAVGSSFSDAVAHTSLIGAVILGVGTVLVAFLLPRKGNGHPGRPRSGRRRNSRNSPARRRAERTPAASEP